MAHAHAMDTRPSLSSLSRRLGDEARRYLVDHDNFASGSRRLYSVDQFKKKKNNKTLLIRSTKLPFNMATIHALVKLVNKQVQTKGF